MGRRNVPLPRRPTCAGDRLCSVQHHPQPKGSPHPEGPLHSVPGHGGDLPVLAEPPPSLHLSSSLSPSLVQPVLPVEFSSSSQHLPRTCPSPGWALGAQR